MSSLMIVLFVLFLVAAIWTVVTARLIISAIGLAVTSAILSIIMYTQGAHLAAVMELSVCAGLITVIFVGAISLVHPLTRGEWKEYVQRRRRRFIALPVVIIAAALLMLAWPLKFDAEIARTVADIDVRQAIWTLRPFDLIGQIAIILTGALGIVVLFKPNGDRKRGS